MMVLSLAGILLWLLLGKASSPTASPAVETAPTSRIVSEPQVLPSTTPSPIEHIDQLQMSEPVELKVAGVLAAPFGGSIVPNDSNQLVPPTSSEVFRWADRGLPGCPSDDTVYVLGHTVRAGGGVFDRLQTIERGQKIVLRTETGFIRYEVTRTKLYDKEGITSKDHVYARVPDRLILIGCYLNPDGSTQDKNFVVIARSQC